MSLWTNTGVTRNHGISYPIIQGPFGRGGSTARLTATVSGVGGLGSPTAAAEDETYDRKSLWLSGRFIHSIPGTRPPKR